MCVCLYGMVVCTPKHGVYVHVLIMPGDVILKGNETLSLIGYD